MTSIRVCPLCGEPADYDNDFGWSRCTHEPYGPIEPVEVKGHREDGRLVFALPDAEEWKRTTGAEMLEEKAERERKRAEWLALSCDERVAINEKRRSLIGGQFAAALIREMYMPFFAGSSMPKIKVPCPRCGDVGCENATERDNPHYVPPGFWKGGFTAVIEGGSAAP